MPDSPDWSAFELVSEPTRAHLDLTQLAEHRFADGGGYPPSYRAFIERFGWARTLGL